MATLGRSQSASTYRVATIPGVLDVTTLGEKDKDQAKAKERWGGGGADDGDVRGLHDLEMAWRDCEAIGTVCECTVLAELFDGDIHDLHRLKIAWMANYLK